MKDVAAAAVNYEKAEFEYIGTLPQKSEVCTDIASSYVAALANERPQQGIHNGEKEYEDICRCISILTSKREFGAPDEDVGLDQYVDTYLPSLTTDTFMGKESGDIVHPRDYSYSKNHAVTETNIISQLISNEIKFMTRKVKDGFEKLNGNSEPVERLSNSSNYDSARSKHGHYNNVVNDVLPWLESNTPRKITKIVGVSEDGTKYMCTKYGQVICALADADLPLWQVAFLEKPLDTKGVEFAKRFDEDCGGEYLGLDRRFGTLILLYAQVHVEPWLKAIEAMNSTQYNGDKHVTDYSEEEVNKFIEETGMSVPKKRCVPVYEPGGKVRWVSCAEFALLMFQQVFADDLRSLYSNVTGCRAGLTQSDHLFEFEREFGSKTMDTLLSGAHPSARLTKTLVRQLQRLKN